MQLLPPRDRTTRPITDRVKESLFSILQPRLVDARVADLFCGTGSMGLESLSRGAAHAIMVDADHDALTRLKKNIDKLGFAAQTTVVRTDIFRTGIPIPATQTARCDLVFVDPPYRLSLDSTLQAPLGRLLIKLSEQVAEDAQVVVRTDRRTTLLDTYDQLRLQQQRTYGSMTLTFLEKTVAPQT